jgi:hypothetical protein
MTQLEEAPTVRAVLGDAIRFITMPAFAEKDRMHAHSTGYKTRISEFKKLGATVVKFWNAPRLYEVSPEPFAKNPFRLNSPERYELMRFAEGLGMMFMTHIGDPDTWFSTRYTDANKYGTKAQQYEDLEEALERFKIPWIAAHMGGYPEDLSVLSNLLERHENLYLDCSATKWVVRELSKHNPEDVRTFFCRWEGRILFGSDIVTYDSHLSHGEGKSEMAAKASNRDEAFALYASRYWALRTLFETEYQGESPIADPDLHLVDPIRFTPDDAPMLQGVALPKSTLEWLYYKTAERLLQ